ncbi:hypothetical protein Tco_0371489 [Tanacetum coccineum]
MEALIEDENAMDKGVADTVKDHKRKHYDNEDDDDEDPPAGPNQGKKTKRRRTKESESSKKPSSTKETPKGKTPTKGSKTGKSTSAKEPVEEPIVEVVMDDAGDDVARDNNQPQDTSKPKTRKTLNPEWFKQPLRPPTPDPKWNKHEVVLDQPAQHWFNQMVYALKDPLTFNDLMATPIDFSKYVLNGLKIESLTQDILLGPAFNLLKGTCSSSIELEYNFQECLNDLTDKLDWNNPEGDQYLKTSNPEVTYTTSITKIKAARYEIKGIEDMISKFSKKNVYSTKAILGVKSVSVKKLHGYGHLEEIAVKRSDQQLYKFKKGDFVDLHLKTLKICFFLYKLFHLDNDLEYLKTSDPEVTYTTSITKTQAARYEIKGIEDMVPTLWSTIKHAYDKDAKKGIKHWGERCKLWYRSQISKFSKKNIYSTKAILGVKSVSVKKLHGYGHLEKIAVKRSDQQLHMACHMNIEFKEPYTSSYDPPGIVYEDLDKQKRVLRADELYKFSDGTLKSVLDEIHHRVLDFRLDYNLEMPKRKWTAVDQKRSCLMIELIDKQLREREIIRNLERLVGARELKMDYKLITRTV